VLRHKWYVLRAGRRLGVPLWRLLVHDLSKFSRAEWGAYVDRYVTGRYVQSEWDRAWAHHCRHNPHHWQHWMGAKMPEHFAREMLADWTAAGQTYSGTDDPREWYAWNRDQIVLHPATRDLVEELMGWPS
jgi:hypothetical protein